jgi:hypothetical protein
MASGGLLDKFRSFVFGNESGRISGSVTVTPDGSKVFKGVEIKPLDTNFDFDHNTWNIPLEVVREYFRRKYDPNKYGTSYDIQYRGADGEQARGRVYAPFTGENLNEALQMERVPYGLLPSITGETPLPYVRQYSQYREKIDGERGAWLGHGWRHITCEVSLIATGLS